MRQKEPAPQGSGKGWLVGIHCKLEVKGASLQPSGQHESPILES